MFLAPVLPPGAAEHSRAAASQIECSQDQTATYTDQELLAMPPLLLWRRLWAWLGGLPGVKVGATCAMLFQLALPAACIKFNWATRWILRQVRTAWMLQPA